MKKKQKEKLDQILYDKTSGSSEVLSKLNKVLLSNIKDKNFITQAISTTKERLSHFAVINNYVNDIKKLSDSNDHKLLVNFLNDYEEEEKLKIKKIFTNINKKLPSAKTILTISKSGTLINVFKLWHNKNANLKIIIMESRPASEGRLMAKELLKRGLKVEMITDAMAGIFVPKADAVIIGADAVHKNGNVINKAGSLSIALLCKHFRKPFYVVTTKSKFANKMRYTINEENPDKVWKYSHPNLTTTNIAFEEIDNKLINEIITEE